MSRKNWNNPAGKNDDSYNIGVTTLATLNKITRGNLVETGKEKNKEIYDSKNIKSTQLNAGITIHVDENKNQNRNQIEHGE